MMMCNHSFIYGCVLYIVSLTHYRILKSGKSKEEKILPCIPKKRKRTAFAEEWNWPPYLNFPRHKSRSGFKTGGQNGREN